MRAIEAVKLTIGQQYASARLVVLVLMDQMLLKKMQLWLSWADHSSGRKQSL